MSMGRVKVIMEIEFAKKNWINVGKSIWININTINIKV